MGLDFTFMLFLWGGGGKESILRTHGGQHSCVLFLISKYEYKKKINAVKNGSMFDSRRSWFLHIFYNIFYDIKNTELHVFAVNVKEPKFHI